MERTGYGVSNLKEKMMAASRSKADLRRWAREYSRTLPEDRTLQASERLAANLKTVEEFQRARHILTCLSFDNEVDTWRIVDELASDPDRTVYVPRVSPAASIHVHPYPCRLRTLRMGLRQPEKTEPELPPDRIDATLDVTLVLGLAFDRQHGYRLGQGKGYFDRFLRGRTFCVIGLSLDSFLIDDIPVEPHDIPMRVIVTEERVYRYEDQREENLR
jgi:5-formyltetrahydrofolate cyclo-ligase